MDTEDLRNEITALHATEQNLREVNAELLEAMKGMLSDRVYEYNERAARAAIAKAEEQQ